VDAVSAERKLLWIVAVLAFWAFGEFLADWLYPADTITLYAH